MQCIWPFLACGIIAFVAVIKGIDLVANKCDELEKRIKALEEKK